LEKETPNESKQIHEQDKRKKKRTTSKKQLTVKQRKGETVLRKIKNALGDTAAKIKTLLPRKSGGIKKRNGYCQRKRLESQDGVLCCLV
jgi:hypothetical protein